MQKELQSLPHTTQKKLKMDHLITDLNLIMNTVILLEEIVRGNLCYPGIAIRTHI